MKKRKVKVVPQSDIAIIKNDLLYVKYALKWVLGIITMSIFSIVAMAVWFGNMQSAIAKTSDDLKDLKQLHYHATIVPNKGELK